MKRSIVVVLVAAAALLAAGAAFAQPPTASEKRLLNDVRVLKTQVKTLQTQVKTMQTQVKKANENLEEAVLIGLTAFVVSACNVAITADAVQGTWAVIDQLSAATQAGKVYFGAQTPVSDTVGGQGICSLIRVTRSQTIPPVIAPFVQLMAVLTTTGNAYTFTGPLAR